MKSLSTTVSVLYDDLILLAQKPWKYDMAEKLLNDYTTYTLDKSWGMLIIHACMYENYKFADLIKTKNSIDLKTMFTNRIEIVNLWCSMESILKKKLIQLQKL